MYFVTNFIFVSIKFSLYIYIMLNMCKFVIFLQYISILALKHCANHFFSRYMATMSPKMCESDLYNGVSKRYSQKFMILCFWGFTTHLSYRPMGAPHRGVPMGRSRYCRRTKSIPRSFATPGGGRGVTIKYLKLCRFLLLYIV